MFKKTPLVLQFTLGALLVLVFGALLVGFESQPQPAGEAFTPTAKQLQATANSVDKLQTDFIKPKQSIGGGSINDLLIKHKEDYVKSTKPEEKDAITKQIIFLSSLRKKQMLELAEKEPLAFFAQTLKKDVREALPEEAKENIEEEITLDATIEVLHIDDFENPKNSKFEYFLQKGTERFNFYPTQDPNAAGTSVRITGYQLDDTIVARIAPPTFYIYPKPEPLPNIDSIGEQKTLVFLVIDSESTEPIPFTREQANDIVFNSQFQNFMQEQSYDRVSFSGDVYGWITLEGFHGCSLVGQSLLNLPEIQNFILNNNINLESYDRLVTITPSCGQGGISSVGKQVLDFEGTTYRLSTAAIGSNHFDIPYGFGATGEFFSFNHIDFVLSHELGHSLGLVHANGWDCGNQVLYGDCEGIEYGNQFDAMGLNGRSLHYNAFYKQLLGWLSPSSILKITQSGRYSLSPLESNSGKRGAYIQRIGPDGRPLKPYYLLEHRQAIGFDRSLFHPDLSSNENGLFINKIIGPTQIFSFLQTLLLDASASESDWSEDTMQTTLNPGQIFEDSENYGIRLQTVSRDDSGLTFDATFLPMQCTRRQPSIENINFDGVITSNAGSLTTWVSFYNADSIWCENSRFGISPVDFPHDWTFEVYGPGEEIVLADYAELVSLSARISVPIGTQLGTYPLSFAVINLDSGEQAIIDGLVTVVDPLIINEIEPTSGTVGTDIVIRGSGFPAGETLRLEFGLPGVVNQSYSVIPSDDLTIPWTIPTLMSSENGEIQTPPGIYELVIYSDSGFIYSNIATFEVLSNSEDTAKKIFVTSKTWTGKFDHPTGGIIAADYRCQEAANNAAVEGTFKAWISDSATSASQRLEYNDAPFIRIDGIAVANHWADLVDGTLLAPININEFGQSTDGSNLEVWTGTKYTGIASQDNCNNWTIDTNLAVGDTGSNQFTDQQWTQFGEATCDNQFRLYCIEQ